MIFGWLKRRRRRKLLAEPWPEAWSPFVERLTFYETLGDDERARLRDILRVIVREKRWTGCGGQRIDDEIRVTVAAQAAVLLLAIEHDHYRRVAEILVYPSTFLVPEGASYSGGAPGTPVDGMAWYRGPVILAWDAVRIGGDNWKDGRNVTLHEFAHKLDMLDGLVDGAPPLAGEEQREAWARIMGREYEALVAASDAGRATLLDDYGATNPPEFFAVVSECFFERPVQLRRRHGELYELLAAWYRQDPASRL